MRTLLVQLTTLLCICVTNGLKIFDSTTLGQDPATVNRLNGESFQQDAIVTFNGQLYYFWLEDMSLNTPQIINTPYSGLLVPQTLLFATPTSPVVP